MQNEERDLARRTFLAGLGVAAGIGFLGLNAPATAAQLLPRDWRRSLADGYLTSGAAFNVRPLQDGLELWEAADGGYLIVESSRHLLLEGSPTAPSPYRGIQGDLAYLGPAGYFGSVGGDSRNTLTGEPATASEVRALGVDAAALMRERAAPAAATTSIALSAVANGLTPVKPGDVKYRVTSYGYITGSRIYPNSQGICGWVAGSIVTRYWHARSTARKLLPSSYRVGTNMTASPNFATYLQGNSGNSSWARDVKDRLIWNANKQNVSHGAAWALGTLGMINSLKANEPVIVYGTIPTGDKKKGAHAVVAYGQANDGSLITHYGWSGYTSILLNSGLAGSNTKFRLK